MLINTKIIEAMKPCSDRFNNWKMHYGSEEMSFADFLDLDKINYIDKVWVARHLLNKNQLSHWAILCADSVLPIFEAEYPHESIVKNLLSLLKSIPDYNNINLAQKRQLLAGREKARNIFARYITIAYAAYAAIDAVSAVIDADDSSGYYSAYAAIDSVFASSAAHNYNLEAEQKQRDLNLTFLKMAATL